MTRSNFRVQCWLVFYRTYIFSYVILFMANLKLSDHIKVPYFIISLLLTLPFLLWRTYTLPQLGSFILALALSVIVSIKSHTIVFIALVWFIFSVQEVPLKQAIKADWQSRSAAFLTIIILTLLHIVPSVEIGRNLVGLRTSLGFVHPNTLGQILVILVGESYYLFGHKYPYLINGTVLLLLIVENLLVNSRSSEIGIIVIILLNFLVSKKNWLTREVKRIGKSVVLTVPWLTALLSCFLIMRFSPTGIYLKLNYLVSNRLFYMNYLANSYPISPWGQFIQPGFGGYQDLTRNIIDNSYFSILMRTGVIALILFLLFLTLLLQKLLRLGQSRLAALLIALLVVGLMESRLNYFQYNPLLLTWFMLEIKSKEITQNES